MLILTRSVNETIVIEPGGIRITLINVLRNDRVRIGIEAPLTHTILREELIGKYDDMKARAERLRRESEDAES